MTTLTLLGGPLDHTALTTSSGSPASYQLLSTSVISGSHAHTTTTSTTGTHRPVNKIAPKRQRQESLSDASSDQSSRSSSVNSKRRTQQSLRGSAVPAVARRNERERNRVRQVNMGFQTLRQHVPNGAKSKKMSKVETLRSAVQYIKQLQQLLNDEEGDEENSVPSFDEQFRHLRPSSQHHQLSATNIQYSGESGLLQGTTTVSFGGLTSPASSPTPSLGSDASSPYDSLSPEDEELLDFTTWLS